jgi:hypothetical protein
MVVASPIRTGERRDRRHVDVAPVAARHDAGDDADGVPTRHTGNRPGQRRRQNAAHLADGGDEEERGEEDEALGRHCIGSGGPGLLLCVCVCVSWAAAWTRYL